MPLQVLWTREPVLTSDEALEIITYPKWLYNFAKDLFAEMEEPEMAFLKLPFMADQEVREVVQFKLAHNMISGAGYDVLTTMFRLLWESHLLIEQTLKMVDNPCVMCSFGKDSLIVLHMVLQHKPDVYVLWNNTTVEFDSTVKLARSLTKEWRLRLIEAQPSITFWDIKNKYGWPEKGRQRGKKAEDKGDNASSKCCYYLKKKPTMQKIKEHGINSTITGLTRFESDIRELSAQQNEPLFYSTSWNGYRCHPIMNWDSETVLEYTNYYSLPVNDVYRPVPDDEDLYEEKYDWRNRANDDTRFQFEDQYFVNKLVPGYEPRTGCWACQIGAKFGKRRYMRMFYPQYFNILVSKMGLGDVLIKRKYPESEQGMFGLPTVDEMLMQRPCFFDKT